MVSGSEGVTEATPVRVRFAPSPTGHLHIGGLRTALFNWLFARHHHGAFLLRIEDTDIERSLPQYVDSIFSALEWADLSSDEPIPFQTQRTALYQKKMEELLSRGHAYRCYCPETDKSEGQFHKYPGTCRNLAPHTTTEPFVIRVKFPEGETIRFHDIIRGPIVFDTNQFDDFIIARSDGTPTYNFVVVVDDIDMKISHVIRGEDHISNTPKQIALYQAFESAPPHFAHLPLILGSSGQRLSKRDAATSVLDYQKAGFLPDALCNYLVRLGWSHGDQEIFTRDELVTHFTLDAVGKSGAIFDMNKLQWINAQYMKVASDSGLVDAITAYVQPNFLELVVWDRPTLLALVGLYKERCSTLRELADQLVTLSQRPVVYSSEGIQKAVVVILPLIELRDRFALVSTWQGPELMALVKEVAAQKGVKLGDIAQPLRCALTGATASPGVGDLLMHLGKQESQERLARFVEYVQKGV